MGITQISQVFVCISLWFGHQSTQIFFLKKFYEYLHIEGTVTYSHNIFLGHFPKIVQIPQDLNRMSPKHKNDFGFDEYFEVPFVGDSGAVALLWVSSMIIVTHLSQST